MIMMSDGLRETMISSAVERAACDIVRYMGANCKDMDATEGKFMVEYLQECKKRLNEKIDEKIKYFENWR
nr:hypothetical protein [uncultured Blautia sp.]